MTAMARLVLLYFLLWVGVTVSTAVDLQKRIIGGRTCDDTDRLYHVMLIATDGTAHSFCGGSLISDRWVLTAAHCWNDSRTMSAYLNIHPHPQNHDEMEIERHEIYRDRNNAQHDIMLLKLKDKAKKPVIHTVPLPDCKTDLQVGNIFQVAGHGHNSTNSTYHFMRQYPDTLQCADMPVVDCRPIKYIFTNDYPNIPYGNFFCADSRRQVTAPGDSGGGVVYNGKIYGIVTGGHATRAFVIPCYFLRVCKYLSWIRRIISGP